MRILVTNDDGIFSPGLETLAQVASRLGQVRVVAPDGERSAVGHAVTIQRPLRYQRTALGGGDMEAYRVNGTPADCVALGLYLWDRPDLVLSGINLGSNLGNEIWHSGTVAAAKQATLLGVHAAAFSLAIDDERADFSPMAAILERVIGIVLDQPLPLVNVNSPAKPQGIQWTHQSVRAYNGAVVEGHDPKGRRHYWFVDTPLTDPDDGSDRWAIEHGLVSLTPLQLDLTDDISLQELLRRPQS